MKATRTALADRDLTVARITALVEDAAALLGMDGQWELTYIFDDGFDGDTVTDSIAPTAACTAAQWQYRRARIRWYLGACAGVSDGRIFAIAVHELVHVLLNPLDSLLPCEDADGWYSERNELATENVTRAILHAAGRSFE